MSDFSSYLAGIIMLVLAGNILWTQSLPQGHRGAYFDIYIGNWAYLIGGIILFFGIYILSYMLFKKNKKSTK